MATTSGEVTPIRRRYLPVQGRNRLAWAFLDAMVLARRSLLQTLRGPQLSGVVAIQPIMFVLLFRYVFGGAIQVPGGEYVNYLMPGIFVQTIAFGGVTTALGPAQATQRDRSVRLGPLLVFSGLVLTYHRRPRAKPLHRDHHAGRRV